MKLSHISPFGTESLKHLARISAPLNHLCTANVDTHFFVYGKEDMNTFITAYDGEEGVELSEVNKKI